MELLRDAIFIWNRAPCLRRDKLRENDIKPHGQETCPPYRITGPRLGGRGDKKR